MLHVAFVLVMSIHNNSMSRKWFLTLNNAIEYGFTHDVIIEKLRMFHLRYFCLSDEIGDSGNYHTHVYLCSDSPIRFSTVQRKFPIAHIEPAYGSSYQLKSYLLKEEDGKHASKAHTKVKDTFYEWGDIPSPEQEKHPMMASIIEEVQSGKSTASIIKDHPNLAFKSNDIDSLRQTLLSERYMVEPRLNLRVCYVVGKSGTGKTRSVYELHDARDVYRMTSYGRILFDGYRGQDVMVFEEFRSQIDIADMLNFIDVHVTYLPARYQNKVATYTQVYIISNINLLEQYKDIQRTQPETWNAFLRRIDTIRVFKENGVYEDYPCEIGGFIPCI